MKKEKTPSAFIFFGRPFVRFFAGAGYENAYYVAILLIAPMVLPLAKIRYCCRTYLWTRLCQICWIGFVNRFRSS